MNAVIIPVLNEESNPVGQRVRTALLPWRERLQIVFVDGGSKDHTVGILRNEGFEVLETGAQSRGVRMQLGLEATTGEMVLFHHPRSVLASEALVWFEGATAKDGWGGFTHQFDVDHPFLRFTSWYSNCGRGRRGILYLDHCIFAPRTWLEEVGGVPSNEIFEDTELSKRLRARSAPAILPFKSVTSSIRFERNGYFKQGLLNQWLKLSYYVKYNDRAMNRRYEKGLELNTVESDQKKI